MQLKVNLENGKETFIIVKDGVEIELTPQEQELLYGYLQVQRYNYNNYNNYITQPIWGGNKTGPLFEVGVTASSEDEESESMKEWKRRGMPDIEEQED